jgi:preprotein translocase subunit SecE
MMNKFGAYLKDVYRELTQKVTWPKWSELQQSAVIVMVASIIIALVVFILDLTFSGLMKAFYGLFY